jgi:hypothetical protein
MRLLLDNNLFPRLVGVLVGVGWDVVHVRKLGLEAAHGVGLPQDGRGGSGYPVASVSLPRSGPGAGVKVEYRMR